MKFMKSVRIKLTDSQIEQLTPIFALAGSYNANNDGVGAIIAQVYEDGMICTFIDEKTSLKVIKAIGSANGKDNYARLSERDKV